METVAHVRPGCPPVKRRSVLKGIGVTSLGTVSVGTAVANVATPDDAQVKVKFPEEDVTVEPEEITPLGDGEYRAEFAGDRDSVTLQDDCSFFCCNCPCPDHCTPPGCACGSWNCTC